VLGEFADELRANDMKLIVSITNMIDGYQGYLHPDRVATHGDGHVDSFPDGELKVERREGDDYSKLRQLNPLLPENPPANAKLIAPRIASLCPRSAHTDYMVSLVDEVTRKYKIDAVTADYIRYSGNSPLLCHCKNCTEAFAIKYPGGKIPGNAWFDFREESILAFARRFHDAAKKNRPAVLTGWYSILFLHDVSRKKVAQQWNGMSEIFDISIPMLYPYLVASEQQGRKGKFVGDINFWIAKWLMKRRFHEFAGDSQVLAITNSIECSARELIQQCRAFDYGHGISVFIYQGTTETQWNALKEYSKELYGKN